MNLSLGFSLFVMIFTFGEGGGDALQGESVGRVRTLRRFQDVCPCTQDTRLERRSRYDT
jgi:hypothetical protein